MAMELWVHVSRLPMLHLDKDRWKLYHGWTLMGCLEPLTILWEIIRTIIIITIFGGKKKG